MGNIKNPSQTKWLSEPVWLYFYNCNHEDLGTSIDFIDWQLLIDFSFKNLISALIFRKEYFLGHR